MHALISKPEYLTLSNHLLDKQWTKLISRTKCCNIQSLINLGGCACKQKKNNPSFYTIIVKQEEHNTRVSEENNP